MFCVDAYCLQHSLRNIIIDFIRKHSTEYKVSLILDITIVYFQRPSFIHVFILL